MIKNGKIFGLINVIDLMIITVVLLGITGFFLVKSGHFVTASKVIEKKSDIEFDVVIRGLKLSKDLDIIKKGDTTFITIRNVPYTDLEIVKVEKEHWKTVISDPKNPLNALAVNDPSAPYTYNYLITLKDAAIVTKDGAVIGGNKIKTGLRVELEGFDYRIPCVVSDVRILD